MSVFLSEIRSPPLRSEAIPWHRTLASQDQVPLGVSPYRIRVSIGASIQRHSHVCSPVGNPVAGSIQMMIVQVFSASQPHGVIGDVREAIVDDGLPGWSMNQNRFEGVVDDDSFPLQPRR